MKDTFSKRQKKVADWLKQENIEAVLFEDTENRRSPNIRYLTGQPGDALCIILKTGKTYLVAWDINMAHEYAHADHIASYTDFERLPSNALAAIIEKENSEKGGKVEIPSNTSYPSFIDYVEKINDFDVICRNDGADTFVQKMRAVKDESEIAIYREASRITDFVINEIEKNVKAGKFSTETDCALFIERILREQGCESTGFETLCAGPSRSFGIHCFPAWGSSSFATKGLSILDFGLKYKGYTSDVTVTFTKGPLSNTQNKMIELVEEAYFEAVKLATYGQKTRVIAEAVDSVFLKAGLKMPHGLGHGIGLEAHEAPAIRSRKDNEWTLENGYIFTLEPGLYDLQEGGVRLENDFIMLNGELEVLTNSRIIHL